MYQEIRGSLCSLLVVLVACLACSCRTSDAPPNFDHLLVEVDTAWKMNDFALAKANAEKILAQYPDYPHDDVKLKLAGCEDMLGNKASAAKIYEELAETSDNKTIRSSCFQFLAFTQRDLGRYAEAVQSYRQALELEENSAKSLKLKFGLGLCLQRSGSFEEAKTVYREIIREAPSSNWARYSRQHSRYPDSFSVQVGAFSKKGNAEKLRNKLRQDGYDVRIDEGLSSTDLRYYYVRVGSWDERGNAERVQKSLVGSRHLAGGRKIAVVP